MERRFANYQEAIYSVSKMVERHNGFIWGGYAVGLYVRNLNYRPHSDIDVICPSESVVGFYNDVANGLINYTPGYPFDEKTKVDSVILDFNRHIKGKNHVYLHILSFSCNDKDYRFPFELTIPLSTKLSSTIQFGNRKYNVASLEVLCLSKKHALECSLMPTRKEHYERDLSVLTNLGK